MITNKKIILLLSILFYPILFFGLNGRIENKKFGLYSVVLSQTFDDGLGKFIITQGKEKVFESSEIDDHYYFGNHFDDRNEDEKDLYSGRDLTGKGIPNLAISNWTGGAHCCHFLHIFELGKKLKKLVSVEANSSSIRLVDLDKDGKPEIEFWDGSIDYLFASFANSPGGRVVLKFINNQYKVASNLMKKPSLKQMQIKKLEIKLKDSFRKEKSQELPYDFLNSMMDLSYSGHFDFAMKLASETWPPDKPGLLEFKNKFTKALQESLYWKDL